MIVPYLKRLTAHCHSKGIFFDLHSCGKNDLLVPAYIEAGVDSWSGQNLNDKETLYEQYGDSIILGIESELPWIPGATPEPEAALSAARRFVNKYGSNYAEKPGYPLGIWPVSRISRYVLYGKPKAVESPEPTAKKGAWRVISESQSQTPCFAAVLQRISRSARHRKTTPLCTAW